MKAVLISAWHVHAREYALQFNSLPGCAIAGVWDEDKARAEALAKELNCPVLASAQEALDLPGVTAAILCSPTTEHLRLIQLIAEKGKHLFTEKVLTAGYQEALKAKEAVEKAGIRFAISYPHLGRPALKKAKEIVDSGRLGKITYARVRNAHDGSSSGWLPPHFYDPKETAGGAMIDLGAHPMYTLQWLLGAPKSVQSLFTQVYGHPVEDNAACLLRYQDGLIAVSETGFVSRGLPYTLEVHGTDGSLIVEDGLRLADKDSQMKLRPVTDLPEASKSPLTLWAECCQEDKAVPEEIGMDAAVALSAIMDAAYRAAKEGREADLP